MDVVNLTGQLVQANVAYLAISVLILLALATAFTIFNFNPIKDELKKQEGKIDKLKEEANVLLEQARDEVSSSIDSFRLKNDIALKAASKRQSLEVDKKIGDVNKSFLNKLAKLTELESSNTLEMNKLISKLQSEIQDMKFDIKELSAFKYEQEGKVGGYSVCIDLLEDVISKNGCKDYRIEFYLRDLRDRIKNNPIDEQYITRIKKIITDLRSNGFDKDAMLKEVEGNIQYKRL